MVSLEAMRRVAGAYVFVFLLAPAALAQTPQPLQISYSPQPTAGEPFQILIVNTPCDGIFENFEFPPRFEIEGNVLKLTTPGVTAGFPGCLYPIQSHAFQAPALPAGSFTLEVYYQHPTIMPPWIMLRQAAPLFVQGAIGANAVPVGGIWSTLALALALIASSLLFVRRSDR